MLAIFCFSSAETGELVDITCGNDGCETEGPENEACYPIDIPDSEFPERDCLKFVRSAPVANENCTLGKSLKTRKLLHSLCKENKNKTTYNSLCTKGLVC